MGSKGQSTTQQSQTYAPNEQAVSAITGAIGQAQNTASLPFNIPQAPVAGFSQDQLAGFQGVRNSQGAAQPYFDQANQYFQQGTQPDISQFFNPMASAVGAQLQNIFGQQNSQNTAQLTQAAGGVGADRIAVGQANLANQQGLAAGQTFANLYQPAVQAAQQQESLQQGAGYGSAALGSAVQNSQLTGANALLGTGGLQQQYQQALLNSPYQQQLAQAAFPYQQSQFLTNAIASLAPGLGGTTYGAGQSTPAQPSIFSQILGGAGVGTALYGAYNGSGSGKGGGSYVPGGSIYNTGNGQISTGTAAGPTPFYAEGGEVDSPFGPAGSSPINVAPQSVIPEGQTARIAPHIPQLNLNPPQQAAQAQGPGLGDIAKMAMMFMARGGNVGDKRFDGADPRAFFRGGYADGGAPSDNGHDLAQAQADADAFEKALREARTQPPEPPIFDDSMDEQQIADAFERALRGNPGDPNHYDEGGIVNPFISRSPAASNDKPSRRMFARGGIPHYDDGGDVINPDEPFRMPGTDAVNAWRKNVDADIKSGDTNVPLPKEITGTPEVTQTGYRAYAPTTASPYGPPPPVTSQQSPPVTSSPGNLIAAPPESNAGQDFAKSPWAALLSASLGTMAGTSPFAGVNIGQGGLQGMKTLEQQRQDAQKDQTIAQSADRLAQEAKFHEDAYNRETLNQRKTREHQEKQDDLAERRFNRPYEQLTKIEQAQVDRQAEQDKFAREKFDRPYNELTKNEQAQLEESKRQHDMSRVPPGFQPKADGTPGIEPIPGGPHAAEQIKAEADAKRLPAMNKEDMKPLVEAYLAGDHSVMNGIGRGTQGPQNVQQFWGMIAETLHNQGADGRQIAAAKADFMGQQAALRVSAQREANVTTAVNEAIKTFPEVERTSKLLNRTNFTPVNAALQAFREKTGSEEQRQYGAAIQAAVTAYSQAMSRTGANSVYAQQHAAEILNKTDSHAALMASIKQLNTEMQIAKSAPEETRKAILSHILGVQDATKGAEGQPGTGATSTQSPPAATALPDAAKAQLKEGQITTFGNGQKWTLQNGQPKQVQ